MLYSCNSGTSCKDDTFTCRDGDDCEIYCAKKKNVCRNAEFNCPTTGDCLIDCVGDRGNVCRSSTINCPTTGDCTINCKQMGGGNVCNGATINCPTTGACALICDGSASSICSSMTINYGSSQFSCTGAQCGSFTKFGIPSHHI